MKAGHIVSSHEEGRNNAAAELNLSLASLYSVWDPGSFQLKVFEMALTNKPRGVPLK